MKPILYKPYGIEENRNYEVYVGTSASLPEKVFCGCATVRNWFRDFTQSEEIMAFCSLDYDFETPLSFTVTPLQIYGSARIRPASAGIEYTFENGVLSFSITKPAKISVEFDGDIYHNLFIFANEPEKDIPSPDDKNVVYIGEGGHNGDIELTDGQTLYIGGNATVFGRVKGTGSNITVRGRGVLCGSNFDHETDKGNMVNMYRCENLNVEGITLLDTPGWAVVPRSCKNVVIRNLKQISYNGNSDGFDICSCENVLIEGCFVRNHDDNISIKAHEGGSKDIVMRRCVLWADRAHNMLIGPESNKNNHNRFENIQFEDIDVLEHKEFHDGFKGVMAIFCADGADFENIVWRNICVERMTHGKLFDFKYVNFYADGYGRSVKNIRVENVCCEAPVVYRCDICGFDGEHIIDGVTLKNIRINGVVAGRGSPYININEFTRNISFE